MRLIYCIGLTLLLVVLWVDHTCSTALPNGAHNLEEDQQSVKPTGGNRLFNRAIRGPQANAPAPRLNAQAKSQPTPQKAVSSPPAPVETENEPEPGEDKPEGGEIEASPAEESVSSTTTSTTENPRRRPGGVVRPIQSKKEFLARLERRRKLQQQNGYTVVPHTSTSTTEKPTKTNPQNTRKTNPPKTPTPPTNQGSPKKATASRRYNVKATTPTQTTPLLPSSNEAIAEESNVATQSSKVRTYPKTRRTNAS